MGVSRPFEMNTGLRKLSIIMTGTASMVKINAAPPDMELHA